MTQAPGADLTGILDNARGRRVLVVGDAMVDHYIWGEAARISPEAPVPVVMANGRTSSPGGAANTAANVVAMAGDAELLAVVGDDDDGRDLGGLLNSLGVRQQLITATDRPTTAKTRVMAGSHQVARIDTERPGALPASAEESLLKAIESTVPGVNAVLISDYAKGAVSETVAHRAIEVARHHGLPVVVDPKGPIFAKYGGASVVTPNESEARQAAGLAVDASLDSVAERLRSILPGSNLLITLGVRGMALYPAQGNRQDVPAISHRVHDVTGAGDTVAAALVVAIAAGTPIPLAVRLANAAAAQAVQQVGVARVTADELRGAISHDAQASAETAPAG